VLELTDNVNWNDGVVLYAKITLECDEGILEDEIYGSNSGGISYASEAERDECKYCDYAPYFVMCYPEMENAESCGRADDTAGFSTCDKQAFSFW